jgi:hypothetical protein
VLKFSQNSCLECCNLSSPNYEPEKFGNLVEEAINLPCQKQKFFTQVALLIHLTVVLELKLWLVKHVCVGFDVANTSDFMIPM